MSAKPKLTAGRKKLQSLGIELPSFPISLNGGLPKHEELRELRYKVSKGVQPESELQRKEKLATELWIREQERAGVDVMVDGGMYRDDMVSYFAKKINGFEPGGIVRCYGNRYYRRPIVKGKCEWKGPLVSEIWRYTQRLTHKPLKAIVTGPFTLMEWSFNEFYTEREAFCEDLTAIIKKEVAELVTNGAKIIQIDEPAFSSHPEEYSLFSDAIKEIIGSQKAYFILHHAFGDLAPFWPKLQSLPVDQLDIDLNYQHNSILPVVKKTPSSKDIAVGIIEAHTHEIESPRQLGDRMRSALKVIEEEKIWWTPDSGLQTRTPEQAGQKIKALFAVVKKFRDG